MKSASLSIGLFCASLCCWAQPGNQSGIAHVAFRVADLETSRGFYNKLGFEQFFEVKQGDKTTQAFLKVNDRQFVELYPRTEASQPLGLMHVCYESSNLEALHAEFAQRGLITSEVRKAGAGNMLMTMKDPEGETIEYTQYLPGSRHYEDRGKHLGAKRVAETMVGATSPAHDAAAMRKFYMEKLGFTAIDGHLRMPGDSEHVVELVTAGPEVRPGVQFGVADLKQAAAMLNELGLKAKGAPASVTVTDPDGTVISFVKVAR